MNGIDRWKLADQLTVYQIALLMAGYDSSEFVESYYNNWKKEVKCDISPYLNAIKNAARSKEFVVKEVIDSEWPSEPDWDRSTVDLFSFR